MLGISRRFNIDCDCSPLTRDELTSGSGAIYTVCGARHCVRMGQLDAHTNANQPPRGSKPLNRLGNR